MKNILIIGDSWGCGEWKWEEVQGYCYGYNPHKGLESYFVDSNFQVVNLSQGGQSNLTGLYKTSLVKIEKFDSIIWIVTDSLRDVSSLHKRYVDLASYEEMVLDSETILRQSFAKANNLGVPILCLGGCAKLPPYISEYPNLIPVISSLTEFLIPGYVHPKLWASFWLNDIKTSNTVAALSVEARIKFIDQILYEKEIQDRLTTEPLFTPDGSHPNRHAWKIVYDYLMENYIK
jgi:hypothetical protein